MDVAVQVGDIAGDQHALRVVPWTCPDAIASINRGLAGGRRGAEVCAPRAAPCPSCRGQILAMTVRPRQPTQVAAIPYADAGDEESHRLLGHLLLLLGWLLRRQWCNTCNRHSDCE